MISWFVTLCLKRSSSQLSFLPNAGEARETDIRFDRAPNLVTNGTARQARRLSARPRPESRFACALGLGLPLAANVGHEPGARLRLFVEPFVTAISVKPHGGAADESLRTRRGRADAVYKMARANHARIAYAPLLLVGPTARGNRLARQVNDRIDCLKRFRRRRAGLRLPPIDFRGLKFPRFVRVARQRDDGVPFC